MQDDSSSPSSNTPRRTSNYLRRPGHYIKRAYQKIREGSSTQFGLAQFVAQFSAISESADRTLIRSYFEGEDLPAIYQPIDERPVSTTFRSPGSNLSEIRAILTTFGSSSPVPIRMTLHRAGEAAVLRSSEINLNIRGDGTVSVFKFEPIVDSAGSWFEVRIGSESEKNNLRTAIHGRILAKNHPIFKSFERSEDGQQISFVENTDERVDRLFGPAASELLFVPRYYGFGADAGRPGHPLQFGWEGLRLKCVPQQLEPDRALSAGFICPLHRLDEIQISFATFDRLNAGTIELRLNEIDSNGDRKPVRSAAIAADSIVNNATHRFKFAPLSPALNLQLELEIECRGCTEDSAPGIWGSLIEAESELARQLSEQPNLIDLSPVPTFGPDRVQPDFPTRSLVPSRLDRVVLLMSQEDWISGNSNLASAARAIRAAGIEVVPVFPQNADYAVQELRRIDAVILFNLPISPALKEIIRLSKLTGRMVIGISPGAGPGALLDLNLEPSDAGRLKEQESLRKQLIENCDLALDNLDSADIAGLHAQYLRRRFPPLTIITADPASAEEQIYPGVCQITPVGESWSEAVKQASGEVIILALDGSIDCESAARHNTALQFGRLDLAIETQAPEFDPSPVMTAFQSGAAISLTKAAAETSGAAEIFDMYAGRSNSSIGIRYARGELAYKIFKSGGWVGVIPRTSGTGAAQSADFVGAFAAAPDLLKKLISRNPSLPVEFRRWFEAAASASGLDTSSLDGLSSSHNVRTGKRGLRILTYRWHVGHQYELYKLPHQFTLASGLGTGFTSRWNYRERPLPQNSRIVSWDRINPADYDLAILHFDENVLSPENCRLKLSADWGESFRRLREQCKLPMIAVCHGTPQFYGQYDISYDKPDLGRVIETERLRLVDYLANILVITNSEQARLEWGFRRSKTIWHGLDPTQFPSSRYNRSILTLGRPMAERPHYRGYFLAQKVFSGLPADIVPGALEVAEPSFALCPESNEYAEARFRNYIDAIRDYSIYFNPTIRSPMPRSRAEAMLCGLAVVTADNHDTERFIQHGVNGFRSNDPDELRKILIDLARNPAAAKKIGSAGRQTACDTFNIDRYLEAWQKVLELIL